MYYVRRGEEGAMLFLFSILALGVFIWFLTLPLVKSKTNKGLYSGHIESIEFTVGKYAMATIKINITGFGDKYRSTITMKKMYYDLQMGAYKLNSGYPVAVEIVDYQLDKSLHSCIVAIKPEGKPDETILKITPSTYNLLDLFEKYSDCDEVIK